MVKIKKESLNHNVTPLFDALKQFKKDNVIPFDVPGHKAGKGLPEFTDYFGKRIMEVDVNSMKQLDNLANPTSVIKEAEELMADAYNADHAFFLINGTTSGVQAMIMSSCNPGDKIILPRNAHKSAVNALILCSAVPIYVQADIRNDLGIVMGVSHKEVEKAIKENPDAKAVFLLNPNYYGAVSELKEIIKIAHEHNMAVLVDEAHGAHLNFHPDFPANATTLGADMAATSLHKTGGSLTQSSVLLLNEGRISKNKVKKILNLTQSTSASYLLMSSLDVARKNLVLNGKERFDKILKHVRYIRNELNKIDGIYAFGKEIIDSNGIADFDESKLGINVAKLGLSGFEVYDILRDDYSIQMELADAYNVLAIISIGDTEENLNKLLEAFKDISKRFKGTKHIIEHPVLENPEVVLSPREAFYADKENIELDNCVNRISGESIMVYPPGIPIITPGERITQNMINYIKFLKTQDTVFNGAEDPDINYIKVVK
ncbi:MAG: arginine decarboxylase [Fusobacteriaceae bacterium]|nr:arginine decarboxylase [Fusobacteriaceae bacterium]